MSGFGPEHLPYGVFARPGTAPRVGARLGDGLLDLDALARAGRLGATPAGLFAGAALNPFLAPVARPWAAVRERLCAARELDARPRTRRADDAVGC